MKRILLLLAASIFVASSARAEAPLMPAIQRVVDAGVLVVALGNDDIDPMVSTDADGSLGGFDVDLARALANAVPDAEGR